MSSSSGIDRKALLYAIGNVSSSVSLVLVNKYVFAGGFRFPMTLTFFHFVFTVGFYRVLAALKMYEPALMRLENTSSGRGFSLKRVMR